MYQYLEDSKKKQLFNVIMALGILLAVFVGVKAINAIKEYSNIGKGVYPSNTISVSGTGEIMMVPDVASFSFSVTELADDVAKAQSASAEKINNIIETVRGFEVAETDIQTTGYNVYPKYEYTRVVCNEFSCPPSRQILVGYEVSQTITIKVRKTEIAGEVLSKVGELGATNISGLNFVIDDIEKVKNEAREQAIENAKEKAKVLSKALGVKLVDVVGFYEDNPYPVYDQAYGGANLSIAREQAAVPQLPTGENKVTSSVTITYEVK